VSEDLYLEVVGTAREAIAAAIESGATVVVVDLAGCAFVDSVGVSLLLTTWGRLQDQGGRLVVANIENGHSRVESEHFPAGPGNVTGVVKGPGDNLYVTCGSCYGRTGGRRLMRDGGTWRELLISPQTQTGMICGNAPLPPPPERSNTAPDVAASAGDGIPHVLPSTNFQALAFDEQGRPCVLCADLGIIRRERDGTWKCATPGWYESCADAQDLAFAGHTAVLASRSAGVVLLDLDTLEGKRVRPR